MKTDLLSEYGEGYCGRCAFVIGLDATGALSPHDRGKHGNYPAACPGGGRPPWKRTPYASRKAAFRVTGGKALCPECGKRVLVVVSVVTGDRLKWHFPSLSKADWCKGTNRLAGK